jgi:hypothetical protein
MGRPRIECLRETPEGTEKLCTGCKEWWPADPEFFYADASDATGLFYRCKACYEEWKQARRAKAQAAKQGGQCMTPKALEDTEERELK